MALCPGNKASVTQQWISCCLRSLGQTSLTWWYRVIRIQQPHFWKKNLPPAASLSSHRCPPPPLFLLFLFPPLPSLEVSRLFTPLRIRRSDFDRRRAGWLMVAAEAAAGRGPIIDGLLKGCG